MSDTPPRELRQPPQQAGGMSQRMGPLPLWGWLLVLVMMVIVYFYLHNKSSSQQAQEATTAGTTAVYNAQGQQIGTIAITPTGTSSTYSTVTSPTPLQVGDQQSQGTRAQWNVNNTPNGQTAAMEPDANTLTASETDGGTPAVNTTIPET